MAERASNNRIVLSLLDDDGDPKYGDFGKIDLLRASADGRTKNARVNPDGKADNYDDSNEACTDDDGGDGCDAEIEIERDVKFVTGTALDCSTTRTVTFTCTWDAQGLAMIGEAVTPVAATVTTLTDDSASTTASYIGKFAKCEVE